MESIKGLLCSTGGNCGVNKGAVVLYWWELWC